MCPSQAFNHRNACLCVVCPARKQLRRPCPRSQRSRGSNRSTPKGLVTVALFRLPWKGAFLLSWRTSPSAADLSLGTCSRIWTDYLKRPNKFESKMKQVFGLNCLNPVFVVPGGGVRLKKKTAQRQQLPQRVFETFSRAWTLALFWLRAIWDVQVFGFFPR